jgi:hypothetical protein
MFDRSGDVPCCELGLRADVEHDDVTGIEPSRAGRG